MTGATQENGALSNITLAYLEGTGWYKIDSNEVSEIWV